MDQFHRGFSLVVLIEKRGEFLLLANQQDLVAKPFGSFNSSYYFRFWVVITSHAI
jgi:hypothetical protein